MLKGLLTSNEPFFRTPKQGDRQRLLGAINDVREETLMMVALWAAAFSIRSIPREIASPDTTVWMVALLIQSIPYAAALGVSIISALELPARILHRPAVAGST